MMIFKAQIWNDGGLLAAGMVNEDLRNGLILLLAVLVIALGAVIWAAFMRKARRRRKRSHRPHTWELDPKAKRGHHHSGRRHRPDSEMPPINPTLAETGGLPPVRTDESPEPPDSHR